MRNGVLNRCSVQRSAVLGITHFVRGRRWNAVLLNLTRCLTVIRFVNVQERLRLFLEDLGHGLTTRFVEIWPWDKLLFEGNAPAHATLRLGIAVETMDPWFQLVQFFVMRRTGDVFLVAEHLISRSDALSLRDHIVRHLLKQL